MSSESSSLISLHIVATDRNGHELGHARATHDGNEYVDPLFQKDRAIIYKELKKIFPDCYLFIRWEREKVKDKVTVPGKPLIQVG